MSADPLAQLKERYRRSLLDKQRQLERLRARLGAGEPGHEQVRALCHKLVGSGASYGYTTISEAAAVVEHAEPDAMAPALDALIAVLVDARAEPR